MSEGTKRIITFMFATIVLTIVGIWGNAWIGFGLLGMIYTFFIVDAIKRMK